MSDYDVIPTYLPPDVDAWRKECDGFWKVFSSSMEGLGFRGLVRLGITQTNIVLPQTQQRPCIFS